jgi:aminoglycoside phosphotransferase (APT) family kinase protein
MISMISNSTPALVDFDRLAAWMDRQGLGEGSILDAKLLSGGNQNVILKFQRSGREFILRRPPPHPRADGNETMRREVRVLQALAGSDVPHAALIAACPSEDILGAAFYLMEPVNGFNATESLPALHAQDPVIRHAMGLALIDGLLALGRIDIATPALSDMRRPDNFIDRQVPRWLQQFLSYRDYRNWPGRGELGDVDSIAEWLIAHKPAGFIPGLMHGDYHIANVMYRYDGPSLAAIFDWELATLGDPLLDLAGLLASWPTDSGERTISMTVDPWDGFPTMGQLVAHYGARTHRDISHLRWYAVLACYRLAILVEGTFARSCDGKAASDAGARAHQAALRLFDRARTWKVRWELG